MDKTEINEKHLEIYFDAGYKEGKDDERGRILKILDNHTLVLQYYDHWSDMIFEITKKVEGAKDG